ncbi:DUF58 domain-containing protein [Actinocorallia sp. A-T 12471]|uniref:DUF58 domain-containing protein n=1 Tax=Actinocorallia sp. A-T 12471 TaxID=3089813 RepID=UPI0029CBFE5C|nr:DUF58 domain-containing protein [Actinocorallia sp. A-T 12471]MDX6741219.1 DUF58 domain-containing protein [Actinocorallia sp. A-T 12471]
MRIPEDRLRRLELKVTGRLDGMLGGEHLGLLPGPGSELAEARAYQPGEDDVRHMDWSVTARTAVPHVRDVIADHELEAWALVDLSPSMDYGTAEYLKRDLAVAALAAVGFTATRLGDRVGAYLMTGPTLRRRPARAGRSRLYGLLREVESAPSEPGPLTLADAITALDRGQRRRGLRVVISDFLDASDWERPLRRMAARHQVLAVEIIDPRELELPATGMIEFADPETGAVQEFLLNARVAEDYQRAAAAQRAGNAAALRRAGAAHLVLRTDRDWVTDIARFALRRRRLGGRA